MHQYSQVDFVDLNAGCPIDIVYQRGGGAALLERPKRLSELLIPMSKVCLISV